MIENHRFSRVKGLSGLQARNLEGFGQAENHEAIF